MPIEGWSQIYAPDVVNIGLYNNIDIHFHF